MAASFQGGPGVDAVEVTLDDAAVDAVGVAMDDDAVDC
jgi:hypothetical protein